MSPSTQQVMAVRYALFAVCGALNVFVLSSFQTNTHGLWMLYGVDILVCAALALLITRLTKRRAE